MDAVGATILAALIAGILGLIGVVILALITLRQSRQTIRSTEAIALRAYQMKDSSEVHADLTAMKLELQRCNEDRAADSLQRKADADRHAGDEEQRRASDERHRADEQRHSVDIEEIARTRSELSILRQDQAEIRHKLRSMADAAKIFGEEMTTGQEIEENESHP